MKLGNKKEALRSFNLCLQYEKNINTIKKVKDAIDKLL